MLNVQLIYQLLQRCKIDQSERFIHGEILTVSNVTKVLDQRKPCRVMKRIMHVILSMKYESET